MIMVDLTKINRPADGLAGAAWAQLCTADGTCGPRFPLNDPSPREGIRFVQDMRRARCRITIDGDTVRIWSPAGGLPLPKTLRRAP
jgi:hypothetical protein